MLLRILPDPRGRRRRPEGVEVASEEGAVTVQNPCLSGGAIEVFLEPAPPAPRVLVVGDTPIAGAVRRIGEELGLEMVAVDVGEPEPARGDLALVVAAHGRDELRSLRRGARGAACRTSAWSPATSAAPACSSELRADGVAEELLERIDVPAGIPIGSRTAAEIALSILAQDRRGAPRRGCGSAPGRAVRVADGRVQPRPRHRRRSRSTRSAG